MPERRVLVIGVGNELRGDDGVALALVRRVREAAADAGADVDEELHEPLELLDAWQGRDAVVIVDAMRSGAPCGTVCRFDASSDRLPAGVSSTGSTHAFGLEAAIELGRALHRLPRLVIVFAVEGRRFEANVALSSEVRASLPELKRAVVREVTELAARSTIESPPVSSSFDRSSGERAAPPGARAGATRRRGR